MNLSPSGGIFGQAGITGINLAVYHNANDLIAFSKALPERTGLEQLGKAAFKN
ncbi:MAG: hypothetical protein GTO13_12660 [Proteobacteria bacterium]|nr:hypothetical protein [Pseudomonadota bacterium]